MSRACCYYYFFNLNERDIIQRRRRRQTFGRQQTKIDSKVSTRSRFDETQRYLLITSLTRPHPPKNWRQTRVRGSYFE